eukprot:PhM_4_TR13977/c4_g7_i9/m.15610
MSTSVPTVRLRVLSVLSLSTNMGTASNETVFGGLVFAASDARDDVSSPPEPQIMLLLLLLLFGLVTPAAAVTAATLPLLRTLLLCMLPCILPFDRECTVVGDVTDDALSTSTDDPERAACARDIFHALTAHSSDGIWPRAKNGCPSSWGTVARIEGSRSSIDLSTSTRMPGTSGSVFTWMRSVAMLSCSSIKLPERKGDLPYTHMYIVTPSAHTSVALPWKGTPCTTSGAWNMGVPFIDSRTSSSRSKFACRMVLTPKSASLHVPSSPTRMFSGLMSMCTTLWLCRYWSPCSTSRKRVRNMAASNGWCGGLKTKFFISVPPPTYSMTMYILSTVGSSMTAVSFTKLG